MKNILLILLVVIASSCRVNRVINQQTQRDSVTTITERSVPVVLKPDTATSKLNLYSFTETFKKADVGAVIAQKRNGRASYTVKKTSDKDFEIVAEAAGVDTTATVQDTKTVVHQKTTTTVEQQPTTLARVWKGVKDYTLLIIVVVVLTLVLLLRLR